MRFVSLLISIFIVFTAKSFSNYLPQQLQLIETYDGFYSFDGTEDSISILIKPNWSGQSEYVYKWKGIQRKNAQGFSFGDETIIDVIVFGDKIVFLSENNLNYKLSLYNTDFDFLSSLSFEADGIHKNNKFIGVISQNNYLLVENRIFEVNSKNELEIVFENILDAEVYNDELFYVEEKYNYITLASSANSNFYSRFDVTDVVNIKVRDELIYVGNSRKNSSVVNLFIVDKNSGRILSNRIINSISEKIDFFEDNIVTIENEQTGNSIRVYEVNKSGEIQQKSSIKIPNELITLLNLQFLNNAIYAVFSNGIVKTDISGSIEFVRFYPISEKGYYSYEIKILNDVIVLSSFNNSIIFETVDDNLWLLKEIGSKFAAYFLILLFIFLTLYFLQKYRHQQRLLSELLDLDSSGAIIIIDRRKHVMFINAKASLLLGISYKNTMNRHIYHGLNTSQGRKILTMINTSIDTQESIRKKITFEVNEYSKEYICNATNIKNLAGQKRGVIFSAIDITEYLEKNRLLNWAQLVHDMQTNLSTIRLNAEQIETEDSLINKAKSKILKQTNILFQKVRDIVTVGRSDSTDLEVIDSSIICQKVSDEFHLRDDNVEISLSCEKFLLECDSRKIIRALRNAIENGIKVLPKSGGKIELNTRKNGKDAIFEVIDNGSGMTDEVKSKMLTPYFTTSKKSGGSGIGTMIMQQVIDQHKGRIEIESEVDLGTKISFVLPNCVVSKDLESIAKRARHGN